MKITKKLMIAAGLFLQLSNLQALNEDQLQSFNDALTTLNNPAADSLSIKDAKAKVDALNIADATVSDSLKAYLTTNTVTPSSKKSAFPKADLKISRPAAPEVQEDTRKHSDADLDAANERADKAEAAQKEAEQSAKAQYDDLNKQLTDQTTINSKLSKELTRNTTKLTELETKVAESDSDIKKLVDAAKNKKGADKYIPLAQKAAQSLHDAIEAIEDKDEQAKVLSAVQAILTPQAPVAASAQSGVNLGRLGKKRRKA